MFSPQAKPLAFGSSLLLAFREVGIEDWEPYVVEDSRFMRPAEVDVLAR